MLGSCVLVVGLLLKFQAGLLIFHMRSHQDLSSDWKIITVMLSDCIPLFLYFYKKYFDVHDLTSTGRHMSSTRLWL